MKLSQAVDLYIQRKRDAGMRFDSPTNKLRSFLRHCGDIDLHHITVQQVTAFLDGSGAMPSTWSGKRGTLRTFFDHWTARGRLKSSPLPPSAPKITQSFVPYIYSRSDLRSLLDTVPRCQRKSACVMSEATFRTLLLFLYATGMRLGEALRLRLADVDLTLGIITIRDTKFYKSRLVPLGPDIERLIRQYLHQPGRRNQTLSPLVSDEER
jgi:integrase/recombinase XerD